MSAISSDVSDKHIIVYTSTCIESTITENIIMTNNLMTILEVILGMEMVMILINSQKMGCGKVFSDKPEPVTRDLRAYIEDW